MENKIKITIDGQSFEIPVDASLLTGLFGNMGMMGNGLLRQRRFNVPMPIAIPVTTPMAMPRAEIQTSHERLQDNFFRLLDNETRTNRAIMTLHRRLQVLEGKGIQTRVPTQNRMMMRSFNMPKIPRVDPKLMESVMKNLYSSLKTALEEPKEIEKPKKPTKAQNRTNVQTKAVPKAKGKSTKVIKKLTKK